MHKADCSYVIITFLSTLGAIAGAPLPSAGLVLIVMIAGSVNVPITGMYAVIVAIGTPLPPLTLLILPFHGETADC